MFGKGEVRVGVSPASAVPRGWGKAVKFLAKELRTVLRETGYEGTIDIDTFDEEDMPVSTLKIEGFTPRGDRAFIVRANVGDADGILMVTEDAVESVREQIGITEETLAKNSGYYHTFGPYQEVWV